MVKRKEWFAVKKTVKAENAVLTFVTIITISIIVILVCSSNKLYLFPEMMALPQTTANLEVYEIPDEVRVQLSTEDLLEVVLNYPLHAYSCQWEDSRAYFNFVKYYFNGLRELLLRQDLGDVLTLHKTDVHDGNQAFLELIREDYELMTSHKAYKCQIEPMASEELMELHNYGSRFK